MSHSFILLDLMILLMSCDQYKLWNSSSCNFLTFVWEEIKYVVMVLSSWIDFIIWSREFMWCISVQQSILELCIGYWFPLMLRITDFSINFVYIYISIRLHIVSISVLAQIINLSHYFFSINLTLIKEKLCFLI